MESTIHRIAWGPGSWVVHVVMTELPTFGLPINPNISSFGNTYEEMPCSIITRAIIEQLWLLKTASDALLRL
jgi:hypothetical protein